MPKMEGAQNHDVDLKHGKYMKVPPAVFSVSPKMAVYNNPCDTPWNCNFEGQDKFLIQWVLE